MYKRLFSLALVFGMAALAPPSFAMACAPRDAMVERLNDHYNETLTARGLQNENALMEIFTSKDTGTYTVLLSRADGISCVVSSGTHWSPAKPVPAGVAG
ncbi:hypothetical protein [Sulfitobacter aestuariivivens]|uniref:Lipoprotein n=1 Tax=Sulfitobacter aestuariivivens TaxID=2766981 RepID=A0A927HEH2_9RHOB|nr:hypothetical protein [Sulfitobacter aestuariivivens]MBD3664777.1 hypothetical protein [Sulfitobacter aestuariivivens]